VHNFSQFVHDTTSGESAAARIEGDPSVFSSESFLWHLWNLVTNQLYLFPFLLFVAGLVVLFRRRSCLTTNLYPALLLVGSYAAATLLHNKDDRYTMPMLSAVAVVATYWLDLLRPRARLWVSGAAVLYSTFTFLAMSFGIPSLPKDTFLHLGPRSLVSGTQSFTPKGEIVTLRGLRVWSQNGYVDGPPSGERWHQEEMFREAARESANRTLWFQSPNDDFIWFNYFGMQYFSLKYGVTWVATPEQADFAGVRSAPGQDLAGPNGFVQVNQFPMPDGGTLRLYRRAATGAGGSGPTGASIADLRRLAASLGHPIYWAGPLRGFVYELTRTPDGRVYVRYLPSGVAVGSTKPFLTVATYPVPNAFAATKAAGVGDGAVHIAIRNGVAFYSRQRPTSVYLAYPGSNYQIEVFDPSPRAAHRIVASGQVQPVR
jgi:hypothetical protein